MHQISKKIMFSVKFLIPQFKKVVPEMVFSVQCDYSNANERNVMDNRILILKRFRQEPGLNLLVETRGIEPLTS